MSRGLIEIDDGKVIPRLQLVDSDGNCIGQFMADTGANAGKVVCFCGEGVADG